MNNDNNQTIGLDGNIKPLENTGVIPQQETPNFIKPVEVSTEEPDILSSVPKPDIMISSPQDTSIDTDVLIEDYVNVNYNIISTKPVNFSALFFGASYMLYRKMYLEGGIVLTLTILLFYILLMVNPLIAPLIFLIVSIILFVSFNKLYIKLSKKKIDRLKNRYKVMSVSELKRICQKKGGTSWVAPIAATILIPVVIGTIMTTFFPVDAEEVFNKIKDTLSNISMPARGSGTSKPSETTEDNITIDNVKRNEEIVLADKVNMQYLTVFKATDKTKPYMYDYVRYTTADNESTYCSFNLSVVTNCDSAVQLLNELASTYDVSNSVGTLTTSKGITWNTVKIENDDEIINIAATSNNENVYLFTYKIAKTADQSLGNTWYNGIIQSIEFK